MSGERILLVEDDDIIAKVTDWRLKNLGYEVCGRAVSASEAMELVVKAMPDLVLMDINIKGDVDGGGALIVEPGDEVTLSFWARDPNEEQVSGVLYSYGKDKDGKPVSLNDGLRF